MSQWNHSDLKCWTLSVEKEPRRFLTPQHKFIERPEEAPASVGLRAISQSPWSRACGSEPPLPGLPSGMACAAIGRSQWSLSPYADDTFRATRFTFRRDYL